MDFALNDILSILAATIRVSIPLIFAAMAGIFSERSGIVISVWRGNSSLVPLPQPVPPQ